MNTLLKYDENQVVVDAIVALNDGRTHQFEGVLPIPIHLDSDIHSLRLFRIGERPKDYREAVRIVTYHPGYWRAVETSNPRTWMNYMTLRPERLDMPTYGKSEIDSLSDLKQELQRTTDKLIYEKIKDIDKRLTAIYVGFSELTLHLEPLLRLTVKPEPQPEQERESIRNEWWDRWQRW